MDETNITTFQHTLLEWYAEHKRDLPWRQTRDPYCICVSEFMLQQTQVSRVIPKYNAWLERFPTVQSLASSPLQDVLRFWSGLGYNRRALNLLALAKEIVNRFEGKFPDNEKDLVSLPGIGTYTARAILCFGFNQQVAVIDTNVKKVVAIKFFEGNVIPQKEMTIFVDALLPQGFAYEWNQALMDYAALTMKNERIPIPKQSKFKGSNRYFRGKILKLLTKKSIQSFDELYDSFSQEIDKKAFSLLLTTLAQEGFLLIDKELISLPT